MTTLVGSLTSAVDAAMLLTEEKIGPRDGAGKTVVVAMSGGVDSAVSALVMRERGYRVVGMNLRLFSPGDVEHAANPCCGIPAMDDARATCAIIGVPFYALNMEEEFGEAVINRFVDDYANGRTPNPCLECNRHVKFRHLVQRARMLGADCLATGHYAASFPAIRSAVFPTSCSAPSMTAKISPTCCTPSIRISSASSSSRSAI